MTRSLTCPECQSKLNVPDNLADKKIQCPKCSALFPVPSDVESAITPEAPLPEPQGVTPNVEPQGVTLEEEVVEPIRRKRDVRTDPTEEAVSTIIPYKNARALIAYYLGVFSLIPCAGLVLGPAAFILGILGLRYVRAHPTAKGTGHAIAGIVLGALTTLGNWGGAIILGIVIGLTASR
jgi:hypothetical protein